MSEYPLGVVSEREYQDLVTIFERKTALSELVKILDADNTALYEKVLKDYADAQSRLVDWWQATAQNHGWIYDSSNSWRFDFGSKEVFLTAPPQE